MMGQQLDDGVPQMMGQQLDDGVPQMMGQQQGGPRQHRFMLPLQLLAQVGSV